MPTPSHAEPKRLPLIASLGIALLALMALLGLLRTPLAAAQGVPVAPTGASIDDGGDVWSRDYADDSGDQSQTATDWYSSPDVWLRQEADVGLIHQNALAGVTNTVYTRLRNRGSAPVTGTVRLAWLEPSLGVDCAGTTIDAVPFANLLPGEERLVRTDWQPPYSGHVGILSVIDSEADPYDPDLVCTPQRVPQDNNVVWHNVHSFDNRDRTRDSRFLKTATLQLINVYDQPKSADLIIERRTFPTTGSIKIRLPDVQFARWWENQARWGEGINVVSTTREIAVTGAVSATVGAIPLQPMESISLSLSFLAATDLEFELSLRETIEGVSIGGVGYRWRLPDRVAPTVVSVSPAADARNTWPTLPFLVKFDEPINRQLFDFTMTPALSGLSFVWDDQNTMVTIDHPPLATGTIYTLSVRAGDAAANSMDAPFQWTFTTRHEDSYLYLPHLSAP